VKYAKIERKLVDFDISSGPEYVEYLKPLSGEMEAIACLAKNPRAATVIRYEVLKLELKNV
jgi:hypothetical protein